jgi:molybdenum cofactor guanylyltransferase
MAFEPYQTVAVVSCGEAFVFLPFVLENTLLQIAGRSYVERTAAAGHDVGEIEALMYAVILGESREMQCDEEQLQILRLRLRMTSETVRVGGMPSAGTVPAPPDAFGFVLAGGRSSRMGRDKALLAFAGETLLARSLRILREAGLAGAVAGSINPFSADAPFVPDREPALGPLSGICAALASTSARFAVFLSVDMPFVPPSLLICLLRHAHITCRVVTVPSVNGFDQTFPVVVEQAALSTLQTELAAGRRGCFSAFHAAAATFRQPVDSLPVELLAQSGQAAHPFGLPPLRWFLNLNTPADIAIAEVLEAAPHRVS